MKLYARVKSERAKKGQGGNRELTVSFFVGSSKHSREIAQVILVADNGEYQLSYLDTETAKVKVCKEGAI